MRFDNLSTCRQHTIQCQRVRRWRRTRAKFPLVPRTIIVLLTHYYEKHGWLQLLLPTTFKSIIVYNLSQGLLFSCKWRNLTIWAIGQADSATKWKLRVSGTAFRDPPKVVPAVFGSVGASSLRKLFVRGSVEAGILPMKLLKSLHGVPQLC